MVGTCGVPVPTHSVNTFATISSAFSTFSSAFMIVSILDTFGKKGLKFHGMLLLMLTIGDFCWLIENVIYNVVQAIFGNLGYCVYWLCIINRSWVQFWLMTTVLTSLAFAVYIFLIVNTNYAPDEEQNNNNYLLINCCIIYYFSAFMVIGFLSCGNLYIAPTGWCDPPPYAHFYFYFLPIIISFFLVLFLYSITFINAGLIQKVQIAKTQVLALRLSGYVLSFLIVWGPDVIIYLLWTSNANYNVPKWVDVLRIVTNTSSGILNFLLYGVVNKQLRKNYTLFSGFVTYIFAPFIVFYLSFRFLFQTSRDLFRSCFSPNNNNFNYNQSNNNNQFKDNSNPKNLSNNEGNINESKYLQCPTDDNFSDINA